MNKKSSFLSQQKNVSVKRDSGLESLLNSEHIVKIEKMAIGGAGVARLQHQQKSVVIFISKSAPQDVLKIKVISVEKNFLNASIVEIITAGPSRREPPCSYAPRCGGCSWQQFSEIEQIIQKENLLKDLFTKFIPHIPYQLQKTVPSPQPFHYRNRIQLKQQGSLLGYYEDKSHQIVDIDYCLIADNRISEEIPRLKKILKPAEQPQKYELKITQDNTFEYLRIGEKGQGLSFSQVNSSLNSILVKTVIEIAQKISPSTLTELYAGSGNFTFELSKVLPNLQIEAVELNPLLTRTATQKIIAHHLQKKLTFFTSDCDAYVKRRPLSKDTILLDPPRAGCTDIVCEKITEAGSENILYVSCHPVSLARDLQKLDLQKNGYAIAWIQVFDMFPQTDHFETLVWLTKNQV